VRLRAEREVDVGYLVSEGAATHGLESMEKKRNNFQVGKMRVNPAEKRGEIKPVRQRGRPKTHGGGTFRSIQKQ